MQESANEPNALREALNGPDHEKWLKAINNEYKSLLKNDTWEVVNKNGSQNPLNAKWVFKINSNDDGNNRFKARLVIQDYAQTKGINYEETFSPVVCYKTIRYLFALAAQKRLKMTHLDIETAYQNSELNEEVYVIPPEPFKSEIGSEKLWKLKKAVYGLKQSGRC